MIKKSLLLTLAILVPWAANAQESIPYNEGFESMSSSDDLTAAGWISYNSQSGSVLKIETSASNVHSGSKALNMDSWNASSSAAILVAGLPVVDAAINTLQITFSYKVSTGTVDVGYLTDVNDASTFVSLAAFNSSSSYSTKTVMLNEAPASAARIAIKYTNYFRCYVDDITVETIPTCFAPQNLTCTEYTATTATLTWQRHAIGTENAWVLQYSTDNTFASGVQSVNVSNTPSKELTGLTAEQTYYARVRPDCDENLWSDVCDFKPSAAQNYTVNDGTTTNDYVPVYGYWADNKQQSEFIIPSTSLTDIAGSKLQAMKFYANYNFTSTGSFQVYLREVENSIFSNTTFYGTEGATTVYTGTITVSSTDGMTITFADDGYDYNGGNLLIGFYQATGGNCSSSGARFYGISANGASISMYSSNSAVQRNFLPKTTFTYLPSATPMPRNLEVSNLTAYEATISWTAPAENVVKYYYQYGPTAGAMSEWVYTNDTLASLAELTPNTAYTFNVYAEYAEGNSGNASKNFTTLESCPAPTGLTVSNITAHEATINWTSAADAWQICVNDDEEHLIEVTETTYNFTSLAPETTYTVKVRTNCGDEYSDWTDNVSFTTLEACPAPTGFAVAENGLTSHTATLNWQGTSNEYQVRYRTAAYMDGIEEGFSSNPAGWSFKQGALNADSTATLSGNTSWSRGTSNGVFDTHIYMNMYGSSSRDYWLITPSMEIQDGYALSFDMAYTAYSGTQVAPAPNSPTHRFAVLISTDDMQHWTILREWNNSDSEYVLDQVSTSGENSGNIDLSAYVGQTAYIAFFGHAEVTNYDNNFHFDNVAIGIPVPAGEMQYASNITEETVTLQGLLAETEYEAWLQGDCGSEGLSTEVGPITFTTDVACPAPTGLAVSNITGHEATINWTSAAEAWQICVNDDEENLIGTNDTTYTLTGLAPETAYTVKVRANCGDDGYSDWTDNVSFTTDVACPAPTNLAASNLTQNTADLTWNGDSDSYNVQYREAATTNQLLFEGFETYADEAALEAVWTVLDLGDGNNTSELGLSSSAKKTGDYGFRFSSYSGSSGGDFDQYLISPELTKAGLLEFAYKSSYGTADKFRVGYSSTTNDVTAFTWGEEMASASSWTTFSETMPENAKYFAINYTAVYQYRLYIDDITIYEITPAGEWQSATSTTTSTQLTGLTAGTEYEVQVQGVCDTVSGNWSEAITFSTLDVIVWNVPADWPNDSVPETYANVTIPANTQVIVPSGYTAYADTITFGENASILIENGGELLHSNEVPVTMQLAYNPNYTSSKDGEPEYGEYRLIAAPVNPGVPVSSTGLVPESTDPNYDYVDLYYFDQNVGELVWINYKYEANDFDSLFIKKGYLYSNAQNVLGIFGGNTLPTNVDVKEPLVYNPDVLWAGWNLVGNPFTCMAFVDRPYYKINGDGDAIAQAEGYSLEVFEGVFVYTEQANDTVTFSTTAPNQGGGVEPGPEEFKMLTLNLNDGRSLIDRAIVRFDEGRQLLKLQMGSSTKVYIPKDGSDYAIVSSDDTGEMPVSFKAENDGTYTMNFSSENVNFSYLHLIDNKTGDNIDLLETPSYTFTARTNDDTNRFKLVFALGTTGIEESFAFFNNGNLVISNEGNATLQVVDVMGRILKSENINGSASVKVDAAPGVYMIRLTNGSNVKVQKVVVE